MRTPRTIRLRRAATSIKDGTHGTYARVDDGIPLLSAKNIQDGHVWVDSAESLVSWDDYRDITRTGTIAKGDVLLTIVGTIGRTALMDVEQPVAFQRSVAAIRPNRRTDARYLRYAIESSATQNQLSALTRQSAQGGVYLSDLASISIPTWDLPIQRAIADYLDRETARIDALIAAKRRMVELLQERAVAFIEDSALKASWTSVALGRVISRIEQGWSPQCDARLPDEGEWGVLKVGCVNGGEFEPDEAKALPGELAPRTEYLVRNGDLLMSRANTRDLVGSTAVVSGVRPMTLLSDKLYRIRLDERKATPRFASLWLQTRGVRSQMELDATGASDSMQNIGQDTVRRVVIPLPDLEKQETFVVLCYRERAQIARVVDSVHQQVRLVQERRQAIITAAVTGQLDIPEVA